MEVTTYTPSLGRERSSRFPSRRKSLKPGLAFESRGMQASTFRPPRLFVDHGVSSAHLSLLLIIWSLTSFVCEVPSGGLGRHRRPPAPPRAVGGDLRRGLLDLDGVADLSPASRSGSSAGACPAL